MTRCSTPCALDYIPTRGDRSVYNSIMKAQNELWAVVRQAPHVDADSLARAMEFVIISDDRLDYRTRLLIRDGLRALETHWGSEQFQTWLLHSPQGADIERACSPEFLDSDPHEIGFPSLEKRVVDAIKPEAIERFLRELSLGITRPTRLMIGGSISLIIAGHLTRNTEDVDVVDEVPVELRTQYKFLADLSDLHHLYLAHFQSHYLPHHWEERIGSFGTFGHLQVFLVDPYDIFTGKLLAIAKKTGPI